jgi:hypothetical protein
LIAVFRDGACCAPIARNDAFAPQFRCALDCVEAISTTAVEAPDWPYSARLWWEPFKRLCWETSAP